jgi:hypothetical protein
LDGWNGLLGARPATLSHCLSITIGIYEGRFSDFSDSLMTFTGNSSTSIIEKKLARDFNGTVDHPVMTKAHPGHLHRRQSLVILLSALSTGAATGPGIAAGDITFHVTAFPATWTPPTVGLVNPRLNATFEIPAEFPAAATEVAPNFTDSALYPSSASTSPGAANETLASYDGFELDLFVRNGGGTLWPCFVREGGRTLRIDAYNATGPPITVAARYAVNFAGANYFECSFATELQPSVPH